jgi:hypothetical protein
MADYTETIVLSDTKVGDRWGGVTAIGPVTINGATPGVALTRVLMTFRIGASTFTLDSSGTSPGITISNAATWLATIPARDSFLSRAGKWSWNLEFWGTGYTSPYTLYSGVITVHDDVD